jgi:hypothetical protein
MDTLKTRTNKPFTHQPFSLHISFHLILHDRIKRAASVKKRFPDLYLHHRIFLSLVYFHPKGFDRGQENANSLQRPFSKNAGCALFRPFSSSSSSSCSAPGRDPKKKKRTRYCMPYTFSFGYIRSHFFSFPLKKVKTS